MEWGCADGQAFFGFSVGDCRGIPLSVASVCEARVFPEDAAVLRSLLMKRVPLVNVLVAAMTGSLSKSSATS